MCSPARYCAPTHTCKSSGGHSEPSIEHPVPLVYQAVGLQNRDLETAHEFWKFLQGTVLLSN